MKAATRTTACLRRPPAAAALALMILLALAPVLLLPALQVNNAAAVFFPADDPAVVAERALRAEFPSDEGLLLLFEGPDLFADPRVAAFAALTHALETLPQVERVISLSTLETIRAAGDTVTIAPVLNSVDTAAMSAEQRRRRAVEDRFANRLLVSPDGQAVAVIIRPVPLSDSREYRALQRASQTAVARHGLTDRFAGMAGTVALQAAQYDSALRDTLRFVPATFALGLTLTAVLFPSMALVGLAALTMLITTGWSMGLFVLVKQPYTLIAAMLPALMAAVSVALLVHIYNALFRAAKLGYRRAARVRYALEQIRRPAVFTALTTAGGFLSLTLSPIPPVAWFGLIAATGIGLLVAVVFVLLPPILRCWAASAEPVARGVIIRLDGPLQAAARLAMRRPIAVVTVFGLAVAAAVPAIARVYVETDIYRFFAADHALTQSTLRAEQQLTGMAPLEVVISVDEVGGLDDPRRLAAVTAFQRWVEGLAAVNRTVSLADVIAELHWAFHAEDPAYRRVPNDAALIAQYLLLYDGRELRELVNEDHTRGRVILSVGVHGAQAIGRLREHIEAYLAQHLPADMRWQVLGLGRLFADQERLLIAGQQRSLAAALALIALAFLALWRSVGAVALCLLPNLGPLLMMFALMGAAGIWLDVATVLFASIVLGIAVDDTIHVFHGYRAGLAAGQRPARALLVSLRQRGRAVTATTLVLCSQFLLLTLSQFQPTVHFGLLTATGLLTAWLFDILLLPALITLRFSAAMRRRLPQPLA